MGDAKTAFEMWERTVKSLQQATASMGAAVKVLQDANANLASPAWDAVEAVRSALLAAAEDEGRKYARVIALQSQTEMPLGESKPRDPAAEAGGHPTVPFTRMPHPVEPSGAEVEGDTGDVDPDVLADEDDEDDDGAEPPAEAAAETPDDLGGCCKPGCSLAAVRVAHGAYFCAFHADAADGGGVL